MTRPFRTMAILLVAILGIALAPVLSVVAASGVASGMGCRLNEADAHPCLVAGFDAGELLYSMFVLGWLALATLPLGAVALLIWLVAAAVLYWRGRPANRRVV